MLEAEAWQPRCDWSHLPKTDVNLMYSIVIIIPKYRTKRLLTVRSMHEFKTSIIACLLCNCWSWKLEPWNAPCDDSLGNSYTVRWHVQFLKCFQLDSISLVNEYMKKQQISPTRSRSSLQPLPVFTFVGPISYWQTCTYRSTAKNNNSIHPHLESLDTKGVCLLRRAYVPIVFCPSYVSRWSVDGAALSA